jgi:hypothetical protein
MDKQGISKDRVVVSGANGQAIDVIETTQGKSTYASVLKQPGRAYASGAVKWKNEFTK